MRVRAVIELFPTGPSCYRGADRSEAENSHLIAIRRPGCERRSGLASRFPCIPNSSLASAGSRASKLSISFDNADKQIEEKFAFCGRKRRENALLPPNPDGANAGMKLLSLGRQPEQACASVASVDAALQKTFLFELCDQQACVIAVNANPRCEADLVEIRLAMFAVEIDERCEFVM